MQQLHGDDADSDDNLSGRTEIGDGILIIDGYAVPLVSASSLASSTAPYYVSASASTSSAGTRYLLTAEDGGPFLHHAADSPFVLLATSAPAEQQQGGADSPPREPNPVPSTRAIDQPLVVASPAQIPVSIRSPQTSFTFQSAVLCVSDFESDRC